MKAVAYNMASEMAHVGVWVTVMLFVVVLPRKRESVGSDCSDKQVTIVCPVSRLAIELDGLSRIECDVSARKEKVDCRISVRTVDIG